MVSRIQCTRAGKNEFIERSPKLFENGASRDARDERIAELERMVGRLATEL
jgi:hypothetical protein